MDIYKFNKLYGTPQSRTLIRKALTSATDVGSGLIPENLEQVITNTAVRLVPELSVPVLKYDPQKWHSFNRLVTIPAAGSAMGENSVTPIRNSTYHRTSTELKILKRKGSITGFLKAAAKDYIDPAVAEMESHIQSFGNDLRTYILFGNALADPYTFHGLDYFIQTNRLNLAGADQVPVDLSILDAMVDANTRLQGKAHRRVLLMSPELLSVLSRHWTTVRDVRNIPGTKDIEVQGGYRLDSYRYIPILETSATRPLAQMGAVVLSATGAGSGLGGAATYFVRVSAVTWDGEQGASPGANSIAVTIEDNLILTFTAVANALFYKVYIGLTEGSEKLVKIVSAFTYDGDGTIATVITTITLTSLPTTPDGTTVPTALQADTPLEYQTGDHLMPNEYMLLWDLDPFQGMGKVAYTNEAGSEFGGLITPMEVANTDDNYPFLLKSYPALIDAFEKTSYIVRGIRTK